MSEPDPSVIIIGAGPAGVSAAWALCERGIQVTMLDAGDTMPAPPPAGNYLDLRFADQEQWRWQLGPGFETFTGPPTASPKLRVPGLRSIFDGYAQANRIRIERDFQLVGALAAGGLSNAWGCGVSRFNRDELGPLAMDHAQMLASYQRVATRCGLSGAEPDEMSEYFGLDAWSSPALPLDPLHARLWDRRDRLSTSKGFRIGRARVAVLSQPRTDRLACDLSGTCLWGCAREATWSAAYEIDRLRRHRCFRYEPGVQVQALKRNGNQGWSIEAIVSNRGLRTIQARRILLASGTIATTRLVLSTLDAPPSRVRLLSNPMAAFLVLLPAALGRGHAKAFGLAQLSFALDDLHVSESATGNLFSTSGLPVSEFLAHLPISRRAGLPMLRALLPSSIVGNIFLPGCLSNHEAGLDRDGSLWISGGHSPELPRVLADAHRRLARAFRSLGAWILPGSFVPGMPGADLHYAATLPIRTQPASHECRLDGQVAGLPGLHVIDGASLPGLPAKAHTLTIMANADRIARLLAFSP